VVGLDVEEVDNLHLDPSFVPFDDGVECIQDEERDETEEDEEEYEVSRSVISRVQALRHFDELKVFFEEHGISTLTLNEQQNLVFAATSKKQMKITDFYRK